MQKSMSVVRRFKSDSECLLLTLTAAAPSGRGQHRDDGSSSSSDAAAATRRGPDAGSAQASHKRDVTRGDDDDDNVGRGDDDNDDVTRGDDDDDVSRAATATMTSPAATTTTTSVARDDDNDDVSRATTTTTSVARRSCATRRGSTGVTAFLVSARTLAPPRLSVCGPLAYTGWLGSRAVSVLDSGGAVGPGFKSQPLRCRVTVSGKLFTPIVPLFTKQRNG